MNQLTARRVYEHRQQKGPFRNRMQLLEVSGLGDATFVQAAGFLKIIGGDDPLDSTWIHPENYAAAKKLLEKLGIDPANVSSSDTAAKIRELVAPMDRQALATELGIGKLALDDMIEALCKPGRDPREDLPPPIFRKDVVKFEDLQTGMELRGTVLNVVDFGAFVDVGLSDSGLVHISQLSSGYVRDPHDVVAVGDQVRVWVSAIDKDRRRVALTMIEPGTEKPRPEKQQRRPRRGQRPPAEAAAAAGQGTSERPRREAGERKPHPAQRTPKPKGDRRDRRGGRREEQRPQRTGAYEKRAPKTVVPITKEMEEGKEYLRSFGDLLQFTKKKKEHEDDEKDATASGGSNKTKPESQEAEVENHEPEQVSETQAANGSESRADSPEPEQATSSAT
jgi:uncharacterized protein